MAAWSLLLVGIIVVSARIGGQQVYDDSPTVKISQGTLQGASTSTADGTKYYKFLGIPYAKPPVDNLRFAAPQEPESWSGVRNATSFGDHCYHGGSGSEDCLFINVFTPQLPISKSGASLLPVMFFLHGGGFVFGSGNISPGQLINYGIVVASINYRLNVFGFLSVNGTDAPGNAGLKDQTAALRWVQKNIATFGGDPNNVTIFGRSAGGASVHYNVLSPLSRGHPNVKVFITQGGLQSTEEAIQMKVPMVGIPIFADQDYNTNLGQDRGVTLRLELNDITKIMFLEAVKKVIEDKSYRENVERLSALLNDQQNTPMERAVWWTEYVIRHRGAKHLRTAAVDMPWYTYLLLDIALFFLAITVLVIVLLTTSVTYIFNKIKLYSSRKRKVN